MGLILFGIIGCFIGSLIVLIAINLFKSKPSIDCQELIKQSEERLEKSKKYGEELDRMLEEMKK
jgi:predicted PurR-regulated permease PerM